jgi:hypothetical protein
MRPRSAARVAMGIVVAALPLVPVGAAQAADPPRNPAAIKPSAELLEYLGTWNGDEEWLHSDEWLATVPPGATRRPPAPPADRSSQGQEQERATTREPTEQGR